MPNNARQIFVDVTQLVHWQGKLTGIPRVMKELALRFASDQAVFVSWVKESREYYEVDLAASLNSGGVSYQSNQPTNLTSRTTSVNRAAKIGLSQITKIAPKTSQLVRSTSLRRHSKKAVMTAGDRLFIPWGEWWDPNFIDRLKKLSRQDQVNLIPLIHDLGPIVQPQFSAHSTVSLTNYCREIVPIASLVLTISQNTKRDLSSWLEQVGKPIPTIKVIREGDDFRVTKSVKPTDSNFVNSGLKGGDFIMDVGTIELKKNHLLLYYVYKLAKARQINLPKLLIVGRSGWKTEDLQELIKTDPDTKDQIKLLLNTSDEELSWLYDHCLFTIQPSFYEGWGIPIAESLARGVPCLASNTSSMVEIAEGIVGHFSPTSTDECLSAITNWIDPINLNQAKIRTKKYRMTTWDTTYQQIKQSIEDLV